MEPIISYSRDGTQRIWVCDGKDSLIKYGDTWRREGPPSADDLKDNFSPMSDPDEAAMLFKEFKAFLASEQKRKKRISTREMIEQYGRAKPTRESIANPGS